MQQNFEAVLKAFAADVTAKFGLNLSFSPEDQLKSPVKTVLEEAGRLLHLDVNAVTEVHVHELGGRPDIGVTAAALLAGYIELKAPGKGANPDKLKGADKTQWQKFQDLPNLLYTDGNEWALYRNGERIGKMIRLAGDVTTDGIEAVSAEDATALFDLLRDFLHWQPIVPATPKALAKMLAPVCRLLRTDVLAALEDPGSNLTMLAQDWRKYLFPDADDKQFADAYAQTLTYALLLARLSGTGDMMSLPSAAKSLRTGHRLLADTLKILGDDAALELIEVPVALLERIIAAVDVSALTNNAQDDPWLYFYEDFLAEYDPKMRKDRGVYYTPVPVVQTQVRLVAELLTTRFDAEFSFVDPHVVTLDPAAGTGTYILTAVQHGLAQIGAAKGSGMRRSAATTAANNVHAFEILVGPYAVAHLRLTQQILKEAGALPADGVHVYLTDTLESPHAIPPGHLPLMYKVLGEEHVRAQQVKSQTSVLVCLGNPPYSRQQITPDEQNAEMRRGGWIRFGEDGKGGLLQDFIDPLISAGLSVHAKNLYNDYVYFWRWALWKVFEAEPKPGIISFITASSYLRGPGFAGMRQVMRQTFDDLWIIDLEGDNLGARKTDNVFAIQTPVAIAIGVRYGEPQPETPAVVHYTKIEGTQADKLQALAEVTSFDSLPWRECLSGWTEPFLPVSDNDYWRWPLLTDIFPWQENGMQFKRSWPIGETAEVLERRWKALLNAPKAERGKLLRETDARKAHKTYAALDDSGENLAALTSLTPGTPPVTPTRYAYRSFDRHWVLKDNRLCDRPRPTLLRSESEQQIYMTGLLTDILGKGPAAVVTAFIPDLHHFCNRGAKDVIPLWRDSDATQPNITHHSLDILNNTYSHIVSAEDLFAYCYALLCTPRYVSRFWDELTIPGPRVPITKDYGLFQQAVALGHTLIWLHTYGERCVPRGEKPGRVPSGKVRCKVGTPTTQAEYPDAFSYDRANQELHIGKGVFEDVRQEIWEFSISGFEVVKSWLGYRMKTRSGKKSSPLDDIRPETWQFDEELLDLLWVLDHTIDLLPDVTAVFERILSSDLFPAAAFPQPTAAERQGPRPTAQAQPLPLFAQVDAEEFD